MEGVYPDRKIWEKCIPIGSYGRVYPDRKIWEEFIQIGRFGWSVSR
jgi:hypothetical protein